MGRALLAVGVACAVYSLKVPMSRAQAVSAQDLARCSKIAADADRLTCYDQVARSNLGAYRAPLEPPPGNRDQAFGMTKPLVSKPPGPSRMEAKVVDVITDAHGTAAVKLDNGQIWSIDDGPVVLDTGNIIVIKRAVLGSFLMTTPTDRVYRVRRLE